MRGMDRMSPLDAAFLDAEDEESNTNMAIASFAVFDGPVPTQSEFEAALASRLPLIPRYRQVVRRPPLDLAAPLWVDDPDFDLSFHVRRTAVPAPGGDAEVFRLIARVMSQRLERSRPLWENWVVEGLEDGRWGLISKVHHCMVDGVSGTQLYHLLLSTSPDDVQIQPVPDDWSPGDPPSTLQLVVDAVGDLVAVPFRQSASVVRMLRQPERFTARATVAARGLTALAGGLVPVPRGSIMGSVRSDRAYAARRVALHDVKTVSHHFGVTVNDVALAACTAGFRRLLLDHGDRCTPTSVRTLVPVSVRAPGEEGIFENRVSCILAALPVHLDDPVERLHAVHEHLAHLKALHEAEAGELVTEVAEREPFPLVSSVIRAMFRLPQRSIATVTTNVPGPREPLYLLGRRMEGLLPYVPIAAGLRFGVAIISYCDEIAFGVTSDFGHEDGARRLVGDIADEVERLLATVGAPV